MRWFPLLLLLTAGTPAAPAAELTSRERELLDGAEARIRAHRVAPLRIEVRDAAGRPVPNTAVRVEHVRHVFQFGAGFDMQLLPRPDETDVDRRHREAFLRLFNVATIHLYWGSYEPRRGAYEDAARSRAIDWLAEHGLTARGHPVFWNHRAAVPGWVDALNPAPDDLAALLDTRLAQLSQAVLPRLRDADVFNELTRWERFTNAFTRFLEARGKVPAVAHYLKETRRLNPHLQTVVNDYDTTPDYAALLRQLIEAGAPIDLIGQQSHMHGGNWPLGQLWTVLERLSGLDRPVLFTELSVLSGPRREIDWRNERRLEGWDTEPGLEAQQAEYLEQFYRLAYSHSNCVGIILWNYSDRRAWLGAPVGVLRKDGTPKPAFERLDHLVNRAWRTGGAFTTDAAGRVLVPDAFEGFYRVSAGGQRRSGEHRKAAPLTVTFALP
jgi:GH35 family endo-1,4-beta-xylanase